MENQMKSIKFMINGKMKTKIKSTAALNDVTIGKLFMDAILEKYPYLRNGDYYEEKEANSQIC